MPTRTSGNVYGDLTGSIFEPQVKSIANVATGTLAVARGGTGLTSVGASGSALVSNGSSFVYATVAGAADSLSAAEVSGALNALTSSISASYMQKSGGTFTGAVTASAGTSASFYRLADGTQLSSSTQLAVISASNPSVGDLLIYQQQLQTGNYWSEKQILSGSLAVDSNDYFGYSISINSTGDRIAVGAYGDERSGGAGPESGLAYVFASSSAGWTQQAILSGSLAVDNGDNFGVSISINSTGDRIAVGAFGDERPAIGSRSGLAYVFASSSSGWREEAILSGSLAVDADDGSGYSISINSAGDRIAVGAPSDERSGGANTSGLAYVFASSSAGWTEQAILSGSLAVAGNDYFGYSISINSTGDRIAVGAYGDERSGGSGSSGLAYVFASSSAGWTEQAILSGSLAVDAFDYFGFSISINSTGDRIAVGAFNDSQPGAGDASGLAYVFASSSAGWTQQAILSGSLAVDVNDRFGSSISINSTGDRIAVGAYTDERSGGSGSSGLAYVFASSSAGWTEQAILSGSLAVDANDNFGVSISINSTGDRIAVGAYGDERSGGASYSGLAYAFELTDIYNTALSLSASKSLSGSYALSGTLQFVPQSTLPAGAAGQFAVSGTSLYFYDGSSWRAVTLI